MPTPNNVTDDASINANVEIEGFFPESITGIIRKCYDGCDFWQCVMIGHFYLDYCRYEARMILCHTYLFSPQFVWMGHLNRLCDCKQFQFVS